MQVRLEPEIRESISIEELAKHIFNVIKKSKEDSHRSRNYPTILQNLLNDLCRNAGGNPLIDDDFAGKFDEAIALLKNQGLLVDVTSDVPKVRLTSLGEKSDLVLDANQLSKFIDKISNGDWYAVQHLFDYLNDKITNNPLYDKYEEKAKQWDEKSMESRIDLFKYELNTKNLSPEDVKALVYSFFKNNSNSNKLDAKIKIPDVQEFINRRLLHYLCDALDDIIKAQSDSSSKPEQKESVMEITSKTKIFVVHGRDRVKYELESLLTSVRYNNSR